MARLQHHHRLPETLQPIGLSRLEAAAFVGVGGTLFDEMVADGRMPQPKRINSRRIWDRRQIEQAFMDLPIEGQTDRDEWDDTAA